MLLSQEMSPLAETSAFDTSAYGTEGVKEDILSKPIGGRNIQ